MENAFPKLKISNHHIFFPQWVVVSLGTTHFWPFGANIPPSNYCYPLTTNHRENVHRINKLSTRHLILAQESHLK